MISALLFAERFTDQREARVQDRALAACASVAVGVYNGPQADPGSQPVDLGTLPCDLERIVFVGNLAASQPSPGGRGALSTDALLEAFSEAVERIARISETERRYFAISWELTSLIRYLRKSLAASENKDTSWALAHAAELYGCEDAATVGSYVGAKALENAIANLDLPTLRAVVVRKVAVVVLRKMLGRDGAQWLGDEEAEKMLGAFGGASGGTHDGRAALATATAIVDGVESASGASLWRLLVSDAGNKADEGRFWNPPFDLASMLAGEAFARAGDQALSPDSEVWHSKRDPESMSHFKVPGVPVPRRYQKPRTASQRASAKINEAVQITEKVLASGSHFNSYDVAAAVAVAMDLSRDDLHAMLERLEYEMGENVMEYEDDAQATYGRMARSDDPMAEARDVLGALMPKTAARSSSARKRARSNPSRRGRRSTSVSSRGRR